MIMWVVMITLAELKNSPLPLAREVRAEKPYEVESTELPKFMPFIYTL